MKKEKIFWGLFFILAGAFIIINQLGIFTNINFVSLFLTIFLVAIAIKSIFHRSTFGVLFSIAFLAIIYAEPLGIESITPWPVLLTALLLTIGLDCIFGHHHHYCHKEMKDFDEETIDDKKTVDVGISFGASTKFITAEDLEKVNVQCSFGAAKVYLEKATFKDDTLRINLDISFSGVELYIPKDCKLENKANVSLGGIDEKNRSNDTTTRRVIISGNVSLSGVEIIYV